MHEERHRRVDVEVGEEGGLNRLLTLLLPNKVISRKESSGES